MAALTWREVSAPNFAGVAESQRAAGQFLNNGFDVLSQALADAQNAPINRRTAELKNLGLGLENDTRTIANDLSRFNNQKTMEFEAARPEALARMTEIRNLFALGTPEGTAQGHALMSKYSPIFASAGITPQQILSIDDQNTGASNAALAQNNAFQQTSDANKARAQDLEAKKIFAEVANVSADPDQMAKAVRARNLDPEVMTRALALIENQGAAITGPAADPRRLLLDKQIEESRQAASDPIDYVTNRIIGAESGNNANAKNPNSSAEGLGQFIDSTWLKTVKQYRPDIAAGRSDDQILALKTNSTLARQMTRNLTAENAQYLQSQGLPVNPGNIYLAHFAGQGGANSILRADPSTPLTSLLDKDAIEANPFMAKWNAGQLRDWAAKKMGGPASAQSANTAAGNSQSASDAIQRALEVSSDNITASDMQSLLTAGTNLAEQGQTLIDAGVTDEAFNRVAPLLASLTTPSEDANIDKATAVKKLHDEVGDEDGLPLDDLTDQFNRVSEKYGLSPHMTEALMKGAIEQTTWGARWIKGDRQLDYDALDAYFRQFINPDAKTEAQKLQPAIEAFRAIRSKRDTTAKIEQMKADVAKAQAELANAQERHKTRPGVDVEGPLLRYQALLGNMQNAIAQLDGNPLMTVNLRDFGPR